MINTKENTQNVYESLSKAALSLNTSSQTVSAYVKSGKLYKGIFKIIRMNSS